MLGRKQIHEKDKRYDTVELNRWTKLAQALRRDVHCTSTSRYYIVWKKKPRKWFNGYFSTNRSDGRWMKKGC